MECDRNIDEYTTNVVYSSMDRNIDEYTTNVLCIRLWTGIKCSKGGHTSSVHALQCKLTVGINQIGTSH